MSALDGVKDVVSDATTESVEALQAQLSAVNSLLLASPSSGFNEQDSSSSENKAQSEGDKVSSITKASRGLLIIGAAAVKLITKGPSAAGRFLSEAFKRIDKSPADLENEKSTLERKLTEAKEKKKSKSPDKSNEKGKDQAKSNENEKQGLISFLWGKLFSKSKAERELSDAEVEEGKTLSAEVKEEANEVVQDMAGDVSNEHEGDLQMIQGNATESSKKGIEI